MDIFQIIKDNLPELPEGVTIADKTIKAIEREIKAHQKNEFVPKESYLNLTDKLIELKSELAEAQGESTEKESYKTKYETEVAAHAETKKTLEKKYSDYESQVNTEKELAAKRSALHKHLEEAGANAKLIGLLAKEFKLESLELDGEKIKNWKDLLKPVQEQYSDVFGEVETVGADTVNPPKGGQPEVNEPKNLSEALHQKYMKKE